MYQTFFSLQNFNKWISVINAFPCQIEVTAQTTWLVPFSDLSLHHQRVLNKKKYCLVYVMPETFIAVS